MELVPGQELELRIDSLSSEGDGIARSDGRVVFVPLAAPGDRLRARVRRVEPRWARAELLEVLAAGPERREPPCPYFARCGGCAWLHLSEKAQAQARIDRVREALRRIGGLPDPPPVEYLASPLALGYRARARFASDGENVGLRRRGARDVVDIERCAVLTPEAQRSLEALRRRQPPPGEYEVRGFGPVAEVAGHGYRVGPGSFFQANAALW